MYDKDLIRDLLTDSTHSIQEANIFFQERLNDKALLDILVDFALDDYSSDASMTASYWISNFTENLLLTIEDKLLILQEYELDNISVHAWIALGKIKSKKGLIYLIEKRISPKLSWEAEALKHHLKEYLNE
ncbi:hypothetical protein WJ0W_005092 [Paenibacillus melissococcoides]|uniref:Immunity protein 30 domain-containing protein n=1 Tax=Paenibacillus melissococcoides TaxID=2912268 RepID=A0ABM9G851_9BACL|nr:MULTISPECIES: hypothetical protein [Paenibacillus]MEB9897947.1 hypothetical protein [Bacillus cereus]CAH8247837.1 hypothetical protein WJ0W_005092 [Paenibacillus melissococcoides]CAH8719393.1 hypothetical protein HTL2_005596 [Paenibacillus melissococcoides]CAH8720401.1 hypothetical protein WDD9_005869 [Paenibacillus melissococcoides]GIO82742.1 hypothetical protein J6TS7_63520 [Paenibacillus dendritiformis]